MMPDEWASIRSIARCVLPVLVGPSTAVTPWPRTTASRDVTEEKEIGIQGSCRWEPSPPRPAVGVSQCDARRGFFVGPTGFANESRTNHERIGDSVGVGI